MTKEEKENWVPLMTPEAQAARMAAIEKLKARLRLTDMVEKLIDFHRAFGCMIGDTPQLVDSATALLRVRLMTSELSETIEAIAVGDMVEILDGLVDTMYVVVGTAIVYGMGDILAEAFNLVHENNMSKVDEDGSVHHDANGKVIKPANYKPVDLRPLLERYGEGSIVDEEPTTPPGPSQRPRPTQHFVG